MGMAEDEGLKEEKIAEAAIHFMENDLPPQNRARLIVLYLSLLGKFDTMIEGFEDGGSATVLAEPLGEVAIDTDLEELNFVMRPLHILSAQKDFAQSKRLWKKLLDPLGSLELESYGRSPIVNLVHFDKELSHLGERTSRVKKMVAYVLLEMKALVQGSSEWKIIKRKREEEEGAANEERPRKRQKREEEEGESSAMGAVRVSTSTKDEDALKVLVFEQRIRELESERDASKCAFEKEKAAHIATMRLMRHFQLAATGVRCQATTDEPEAIPLQATTDEVTTDEPEASPLQATRDEPEAIPLQATTDEPSPGHNR